MIMRAACYERVSTDEQAKFGFSIGTQIDALNEYCEKEHIKIVDHYTDEGVSGGKAAFRRPQMARLLEDVKAKNIDIILFTRLDRWFRNVKEYFKVQEVLDKHGVQWKAIWEDYDTTTSNGRMAITIFLAIAQNEREKTSERIKVIFDNKVKNRESIWGSEKTPFGYTNEIDEHGNKRVVKDPETRDAVERFWELIVKYENVEKASKTVNREFGLQRSMPAWRNNFVNEKYTGRYRGVIDYCEPYVDYKDWKRITDRPIKKAQNQRIYLFTGLIRCPQCGWRMTSTNVVNTLADGTKVDFKSYRCKRKQICDFRRQTGETIIERWLLQNIDKLLKDEIARVKLEEAKPKKKPKTNVSALREQLRRLNVTFVAGAMTDADYLAEVKAINEQIAKAEAESKHEPKEKDLDGLKDVLEKDFRSIYETLDEEDKRRFWRSIIKAIYLDEDGKPYKVDFLYDNE